MRTGLAVTVAATAAICLYAESALAIPPGNYDRTCRGIRETRDGLSATCRDLGGQWRRSSVRFSSCAGRIYIQNINGVLLCQT